MDKVARPQIWGLYPNWTGEWSAQKIALRGMFATLRGSFSCSLQRCEMHFILVRESLYAAGNSSLELIAISKFTDQEDSPLKLWTKNFQNLVNSL
jgi:hypothetical protein